MDLHNLWRLVASFIIAIALGFVLNGIANNPPPTPSCTTLPTAFDEEISLVATEASSEEEYAFPDPCGLEAVVCPGE